MKKDQPIIAFSVFMENDGDGPGRSVEAQAYMLEMTMDNEWPLNVLMMAAPHFVQNMTIYGAAINSMGAIAGASYMPSENNYTQIIEANGKWVFARPSEDYNSIFNAGLKMILSIPNYPEYKDFLPTILKNPKLSNDNFILAFDTSTVSTATSVSEDLSKIKTILADHNLDKVSIIASSWMGDKYLKDYLKIDGIDGLLFLNTPSDAIVEFVKTIV